MIKIYSCGLFTQALDHLQIGKYELGFFVFGCAAIALSSQIHCLGIVMFLLFTCLYFGTYLNLILHAPNVPAYPHCNWELSIT